MQYRPTTVKFMGLPESPGGMWRIRKYILTMKVFILPFFIFLACTAFGNVNVKANFSSDKTAGCPALVVNFTDSSLNATSWYWDFGNGNTSTLENPSATFLTSGLYQVKLVVQNGGETDSMTKTIQVYRVPVAGFTENAPNPCTFDTIHFEPNITLGDAPIVDYAWGFGNGVDVSDSVAFYQYTSNGTYAVTLVIQDSNGCSSNKTTSLTIHVWPSPKAAFTATPVSTCNSSQVVSFKNQSSGAGLSYLWNLDNGITSTAVNPSYKYHDEAYKVVLTVTDSNGCASSASQTVTAEPMQADFSASPVLACTDQKIQFTNNSNYPGTQWYWDFGDGTTSTDENPTKVYLTPGIYSVSFKVTQSPTCGDSITKPAYMNIRPGAPMPIITISADTTQSCHPPLTVHFSTPDTAGMIGYLWDFGDGNAAFVPDPTNTYTTSNTFTVSLTVMDTSGCIASATFPDYISTVGPKTSFSNVIGCPGTPLYFNNPTTGATNFIWNFGDGTIDTTTHNPYHTYANYGTYITTLTAINAIGCNTYDTALVTVDSIHVDFNVSATFSPCPPFAAEFQNTSPRKDLTYKWEFGDGYTDTKTNPVHIYFYPGVYTVTLIGYAPSGCVDSTVYKKLITVQGPTGTFSNNPTTGCMPLRVNYQATITSNTKSVWSDMGDGSVILDTLNFSHVYSGVGIFHPQFVLTDYVGCTVAYPLDSVITHPLPTLSLPDTSVCAGMPVMISLDTTNTYTWEPTNYLSCATCTSTVINAPDTTLYLVTATNQFGCITTANYTINADPLPSLSDSTSFNLCPMDSLPLFVGNAPKIVWSPSTFLNDSTSANPICSPLSSVNYSITAYNKLGCSVNTSVQINVRKKVAITPPQSITVCPNDTLLLHSTLDFSSALGVSYNWSPAQYLDSVGVLSPTAMLSSQTVKFQMIAKSGHCIPDTQSVEATVVPTPDIAVPGPVTTTAGAQVQLYAASHQDLTYTWRANDSMSCTTCSQTDVYPTVSQTVYVEGKNSLGCMVRDSVVIDVVGCNPASVFLPNTFTPNGDGVNDKLFIRSTSLVSLKYFKIYDQWGKLVFETTELDQGWDGSNGGKMDATGVYVYELEGTCQNGYDVIKSGNVAAIR